MASEKKQSAEKSSGKVRYAVVGLGHIAQIAILPAFAHAKTNSELVAIVSNDAEKRAEVGKMYNLERTYSYDEFDDCLASGDVDAVFIALPNHLHREYTERAARAGVHVLCEKPMAVSEDDCRAMIEVCAQNQVRLMIAYRLHFEEANLKAIEIARSGMLGDLRIFNSVFNMQAAEGNIRVREETGGGTLYDIGVYCINAARYLFGDEPTEAVAMSANNGEERFREVDEMTSAILRFPGERLANFTTSFGASDTSVYTIIGTKGELRLDPAYDYAGVLRHHLTIDGKTTQTTFSPRDQFASELIYFSDCVLKKQEPEPSGYEGLADVRIVNCIYQAAMSGQRVAIPPMPPKQRPSMAQEIHRPAVIPPKLVNVESPSGDS